MTGKRQGPPLRWPRPGTGADGVWTAARQEALLVGLRAWARSERPAQEDRGRGHRKKPKELCVKRIDPKHVKLRDGMAKRSRAKIRKPKRFRPLRPKTVPVSIPKLRPRHRRIRTAWVRGMRPKHVKLRDGIAKRSRVKVRKPKRFRPPRSKTAPVPIPELRVRHRKIRTAWVRGMRPKHVKLRDGIAKRSRVKVRKPKRFRPRRPKTVPVPIPELRARHRKIRTAWVRGMRPKHVKLRDGIAKRSRVKVRKPKRFRPLRPKTVPVPIPKLRPRHRKIRTAWIRGMRPKHVKLRDGMAKRSRAKVRKPKRFRPPRPKTVPVSIPKLRPRHRRIRTAWVRGMRPKHVKLRDGMAKRSRVKIRKPKRFRSLRPKTAPVPIPELRARHRKIRTAWVRGMRPKHVKLRDGIAKRSRVKVRKPKRFRPPRSKTAPVPIPELRVRRPRHRKLRYQWVRRLHTKRTKRTERTKHVRLRTCFVEWGKVRRPRHIRLTRQEPPPEREGRRPARSRRIRILFVRGLRRRHPIRRMAHITLGRPRKRRPKRPWIRRGGTVPEETAAPAVREEELPPVPETPPEAKVPEAVPEAEGETPGAPTVPTPEDSGTVTVRLRPSKTPARPVKETPKETGTSKGPKGSKGPVEEEGTEPPAETEEVPRPAGRRRRRRRPKRLRNEGRNWPFRKRERPKPKRLEEVPPPSGWKQFVALARWILFFTAAMAFGAALTIAVEAVRTGSVPLAEEWAAEAPGSLFLTVLLYGTVVALLGAFVGRLWPGGLLVGSAALIVALVDHFKIAIDGTPLVLSDFGLAAQAGDIAGVAGSLRPPEVFWRAVGILLLGTGILFFTSALTRVRGKRAKFLQISTALVLTLTLFARVPAIALGTRSQVDMEDQMDAFLSHGSYGLTVGLWRELFLRQKDAPSGYGAGYMRAVADEIDRLVPRRTMPDEMPNVIVILSESFFDPDRLLPYVTYSRDPVPNFHALKGQSISGRFYSHYLGYGTGYIEAAMQTGIAEPDLVSGTNICFMDEDVYERLDALAEQYTSTGLYRAEMLHAFDDSLYNRVRNYPLFGYSRSLYAKDIKGLGLEREGGMYGGYYMNDAFFFQAVLHEMEKINVSGKRAFIYGITMENHQPFEPDKFGYDHHVAAESDLLDEDETAILDVGLEGLYRADLGLGELVTALRASPEPTILAFFGDHRPTLPMPDEQTVYTHLGLSPGKDTSRWTPEQLGDLYSSDYLIWANDAALLQGQGGTERPSGVLAFGPQVLELTGQPVSRWWALAGLAAKAQLNETKAYYVTGDGTPYRSRSEAVLTDEQEKYLLLRESVIYDDLYGMQYVTGAMNDPPGTPLP